MLGRRGALLGAAAFPVTAVARAQTASRIELPSRRFEIDRFVLDNGLEVLILPSSRAPIVTQMLWYKVGSVDEPTGQSGLAHFLEHLMFKGTPTVAPAAFSRFVSRSGGRDNAFTSYDYTGYYQTVAPAQLEEVIRLEADRMQNLVITEREVLPEREVVLEERRQRIENSPSALLAETASEAMWGRRGYGIPVSGWPDEIRKLGVAEAEAFYRRFYAPDNAVLILAGDVDVARARRLVSDFYGVHRRRGVPERTRPGEPAPDLPKEVVRRDARVRQGEYGRYYVAPSYRMGDTKHVYALQLLAQVLGGGQTSRLWRSLVQDHKIALSAAAVYSGQALGLSYFVVGITPAPGRGLGEIEQALLRQIDRVLQDGVTDEEVTRAANRLLASTIYARDAHASGARTYGAALCTGSTVDDVDAWPQHIAAVTRQQVQEAARAVLGTRQHVVSKLLPSEGGQ